MIALKNTIEFVLSYDVKTEYDYRNVGSFYTIYTGSTGAKYRSFVFYMAKKDKSGIWILYDRCGASREYVKFK